MKFKVFLLASLFFIAPWLQAVTLDIEITNKCSGGFIARIACHHNFFWRMAPFSSSFTLTTIVKPGEVCEIANLWEILAFSYAFTEIDRIEVPKSIPLNAKIKAVVKFKNRGFWNACQPSVLPIVVDKISKTDR